MAKTRDDYVAANRAAWDASAPHHEAGAEFAGLLGGFREPGFSCLDAVLTERLLALGVAGKAVAQICCNNGREILSVKNLGAARCVGFDQSAAFLGQARRLAAAGPVGDPGGAPGGGIACEFVAGDAYAIPAAYDEAFDVVLITIGVFGWMPDLGGFFDVIHRLLKPGGALLVYEQHPIMQMLEPGAADPHKPVNSYFKAGPFEDTGAIVYDGTKDLPGKPQYWFVHTLGDLMTAALDRGLAVEHFREYPHNISSAEFDVYDGQSAQLPQCYILVARKGG
jgi:SAM-dependent methyltransferase